MNFSTRYKLINNLKKFCTQIKQKEARVPTRTPKPEFDVKFFCDPVNKDRIETNIIKRKCRGDINKVLEYSKKSESYEELITEISKIPNVSDPVILDYGDEAKILRTSGNKKDFQFEPKDFSHLAKALKLLRKDDLGPVTGQRSYILVGQLAELEEALIHYTIEKLMNYNFNLVSVPEILPTSMFQACGLEMNGDKSLIYSLDSCYPEDYSLSGTAEIGLANKLIDTELSYDRLPLRLMAVSRCFRAEASSLAEERGVYRVHQFTKVEMFICSEQNKSQQHFDELCNIQEDLFSSLGIHFQVVDMPLRELGAPAYRKIDIEGWMPGRKQYGELSSCSNCTDYQSRRLNIKYRSRDGELLHVHTLNGTACAIPRMMIAICETHQTSHGRILIPNPLIPYMNHNAMIKKQPLADMRIYKYKPKVY